MNSNTNTGSTAAAAAAAGAGAAAATAGSTGTSTATATVATNVQYQSNSNDIIITPNSEFDSTSDSDSDSDSHSNPSNSTADTIDPALLAPGHALNVSNWSELLDNLVLQQLNTNNQSTILDNNSSIIDRLREVINSPSFHNYTARAMDRQFSKSFLVAAIGQFAAIHIPNQQLQGLLREIKSQIDSALLGLFRYYKDGSNVSNTAAGSTTPKSSNNSNKSPSPSSYQPIANYTVNVFPNVKQARMFSLQYALHRRAAIAQVQSQQQSSNNPTNITNNRMGQPVFYVTEGSAVFPAVNRFAWELMLPLSSFRVIQLKQLILPPIDSLSSSDAQLPIYSMDLTALERQIELDINSGFTPIAILTTVGSNLHAGLPYQFDDLAAIRIIADQYGIWVHAEGNNLLLTAASKINDSITSPNSNNNKKLFGLFGRSTPSTANINAIEYPGCPSNTSTIFRCADSICSEALGWFELSGALSLTFLRVDRHIQVPAALPPSSPVNRDIVTNMFLLWFQLLSANQISPTVQAFNNAAANNTNSIKLYQQLLSSNIPSAALTLTARIDRALHVSALLKSLLIATIPKPITTKNGQITQSQPQSQYLFTAIVGPSLSALNEIYPHLLFFQLLPAADSFGIALSEFGLDINRFNRWIFMRLSSSNIDPHSKAAKGYKYQQQQQLANETAAAAGAGAVGENNYIDLQQQQLAGQHNSAIDNADSITVNNVGLDNNTLAIPITPSNNDPTSDSSINPLQSPNTAAFSTHNSIPTVTRVPVSALRAAASHYGLQQLFATSLSQTSYQNRLGFLFHSLSSPAASSSLQSSARDCDIEYLFTAIQNELLCLLYSYQLRNSFQSILLQEPEFISVPFNTIPSDIFIGFGVFQYIPHFAAIELSVIELDLINTDLCWQLNKINPQYMNIQTNEINPRTVIIIQTSQIALNRRCIELLLNELRLGMLRIQLPSTVIDRLGTAVKRGIAEAERELIQANFNSNVRPMVQSIPVLGKLFNWWRPQQLQQQQQQQQHQSNHTHSPSLNPNNPPLNESMSTILLSAGHAFDIRRQELSKVEFGLDNGTS